DGSGGIIAAGEDLPNQIWRRYSSDGTVEWTKQHRNNNIVLAMTANDSGRIWILWVSPFRLETYTAAGDLDWTSGVLGSTTGYGGLALDSVDNVYAVGQTSNQWESFYVSKYDPAGIPLWTDLHNDPDIFELGHAIAALPNDGALVAGYTDSDGVNVEKNGLLSWFTSDGDHLLDVAFDGAPNNDADVLRDVATATEGYAVAVGAHESTSAGHLLWLVKIAI